MKYILLIPFMSNLGSKDVIIQHKKYINSKINHLICDRDHNQFDPPPFFFLHTY